jgi:hypothetical protein
MKLSIESDGTLKGTSLEFRMTADEIPKMISRHRRRKLKLRSRQPPDIVVDPRLSLEAPAAGVVSSRMN